ncbi:uncharacterized protein K489DRAFT_331978 [Dissoconium aciculare CBS 342.82]|uniref:Uncharacterized protein n=1 Tax=Dissoconium aciculare CBS 342.82 TaxID=1314786 RepID=A0A6J3MH34_9PEZI|nr:uncharacterized protein K489DRAFT_331978 [Dissoconium aciculare CBS 342.82]KAF1826207.1 hypothetical protein K489DRAFT_331978 [Dissoconium aciculare CBS 342.82]
MAVLDAMGLDEAETRPRTGIDSIALDADLYDFAVDISRKATPAQGAGGSRPRSTASALTNALDQHQLSPRAALVDGDDQPSEDQPKADGDQPKANSNQQNANQQNSNQQNSNQQNSNQQNANQQNSNQQNANQQKSNQQNANQQNANQAKANGNQPQAGDDKPKANPVMGAADPTVTTPAWLNDVMTHDWGKDSSSDMQYASAKYSTALAENPDLAKVNMTGMEFNAVARIMNSTQRGCYADSALPMALAANDTCNLGFFCKSTLSRILPTFRR